MAFLKNLPVLLALLLLAASPSPTPSGSNNYYYSGDWYYSGLPAGSQQQYQPKQNAPLSRLAPDALESPPTGPIHDTIPDQSSNTSEQAREGWLAWLFAILWRINWSNWALVAVAIGAAKIAFDTLKSIKTQGEIAMKSANAAERSADALIQEKVPYLFVEDVSMGNSRSGQHRS